MSQEQRSTHALTTTPDSPWGRYRPVSAWLETPTDIQPELEGAANADVIVVGGGYAGLSTALELRARGGNVVLLEREFAGWGASGLNGGYLVGAQNSEFAFVNLAGPVDGK